MFEMVKLFEMVLFVLSVIGLTHIMVDGKIIAPIRDWLATPTLPWYLGFFRYSPGIIKHPILWLIAKTSSMITCYQCCGTWCGFLCGWIVFTSISAWHILACGFAGSFLASLANTYMDYLTAQTIINLPDEETTP